MRILVTGSTGQVGWELLKALGPDATVIPADRQRMDLADPDAIVECITHERPDVIINAAGYTAVDRAELEPELAKRLNADAVGVIGEQANRIGAAVVHYSTDYIFDGAKTTPYAPGDDASPLNVYGRTKLQGEHALIDSGASLLILRTCWVYSLRRRNFLKAILDRAAAGGELRVVNDQIGSPTWCRVIAQATAHILHKSLREENGRWHFGDYEGIYHLACGGQTHWHGFAQRIVELADVQPRPTLIPISAAEYGARAMRPKYSVLDCSATIKTFNVKLPHWNDALEHALGERAAGDRTARAAMDLSASAAGASQ